MPTGARAKTATPADPASGAALLVEAAKLHPGVADLMRLYQQHSETSLRAAPYVLKTQSRKFIFAAGSTTAQD